MKEMTTLVRRELWEHPSLWRAPLVMALLFLGLSVGGRFEVGAKSMLTLEQGTAVMGATVMVMGLMIFAIAGIVVVFYLLDCLFAERRDRSILFWKSLPVSDTATVLSKFLLAIVIVPLAVYALSVATDLMVRGILSLRAGSERVSLSFPLWDSATWFKSQALLFTSLVASMIWYAPLAAYLMLVSSWARRNVMLWAILPPFVVVVMERMALGTTHVFDFIADRLKPIMPLMHGIEGRFDDATVAFHKEKLPSTTKLLEQLDFGAMFFNAPTLLGLLAAAILLYLVIRLRRYRDDT